MADQCTWTSSSIRADGDDMDDCDDERASPLPIDYRQPATRQAPPDRLPALWPLLIGGLVGLLIVAYGVFVTRLPVPFPGGE